MSEWVHTYEALESFAGKAMELYRQKISQAGIDSNFLEGLTKEIEVESGNYMVSLHLEEYWKHIEEGRKPGKFLPREALDNWVKANIKLPRPDKKGRLPTVKQLAYLVNRKIARQGIPARPFLSNTVEEVFSSFIDTLAGAFATDVEACAATMLDSLISKNK
ncbi:MAG: hypothetical protein LUG98_11580 [Tannerellaceae bacterium]|nr:hypothetical protein [Tannerellaceae bacterium]